MSKAWFTKPLGMFAGVEQTQNFRSLSSIVPCRVVRRATRPYRFNRGVYNQFVYGPRPRPRPRPARSRQRQADPMSDGNVHTRALEEKAVGVLAFIGG